jgi:osmotically-inducible protein OsmY
MADLAHRLGTPILNPEKYPKLAADKVGTLTRIDVDTVLSLNGIVQSPQDKARAKQLAMQVDGVRAVRNNLQVQQSK